MNSNPTPHSRIAAAVVTHNRLGDLQMNVAALRDQTRAPDKIIVINNDSSDGTREWLDKQPDLHVVHQENRGAGNGIATALTEMVEMGYDWAWALDDDAIPERDALEAICRAMAAYPTGRVFNSLGLARQDPTQFAVGALHVRTASNNYLQGQMVPSPAALAPDANGLVDSIGGHFWLGVCIHRSVVETVGVPYEWLFIRGDEVEYGLRMMRAGYHIYSVVDSRVMHPIVASYQIKVLGKTKTIKTPSSDKWYYALRNGIWIRRVYYAPAPVLPYAARRLGGALASEWLAAPDKTLRQKLAGSRLAVRGVADGLRLPLSLDAPPHQTGKAQ